MNLTRTLAEFASGLRWEDLPTDVRRASKWCVADFLAGAVAGRGQESSKAVVSACGTWRQTGACTVIGDGRDYSVEGAAFLNAFISEVLEMGHGHGDGGGHLGATTIPVALAVAENLGLNSRDTLTAIVAGYEVFARVGGSVSPTLQHRGFISTGMSGVFGAAASAARAMGWKVDATHNSIGVAAYLAPVSSISGYYGTVNSAEAAQASWQGVVSARIGASGIFGAEDPAADYCERFGDLHRLRRYVAELGQKYEILNLYFKPLPGCRFTHGVAEAMSSLLLQQGLSPDRVEGITARVTPEGLQLCGSYTDISTPFVRAQFSIPYVIATMVFDGSIGTDSFSAPRAGRQEVHRFARDRIHLQPSWEGQEAVDFAAAEVELVTTEGHRHIARVPVPKGSPGNPLTDQDLEQKVLHLVEPILGRSAARRLLDGVLNMDLGGDNSVRNLLEMASLADPSPRKLAG